MSFNEESDPIKDMGIGVDSIIKEWLNTSNSRIDIKCDVNSVYVITILSGAIILETRKPPSNINFEVKFEECEGHLTIKDELSIDQIYTRIRNTYQDIINDNLPYQDKNGFPINKVDIEKSRDYINGLPSKSSKSVRESMLQEIKQGLLEYASNIKDQYGISIVEYTAILKKSSRPINSFIQV